MNLDSLSKVPLDDGTCSEDNIKCTSSHLNYCGKPVPRGWICTRPKGHEGKCVACMNYYNGDIEYYRKYRHNLT